MAGRFLLGAGLGGLLGTGVLALVSLLAVPPGAPRAVVETGKNAGAEATAGADGDAGALPGTGSSATGAETTEAATEAGGTETGPAAAGSPGAGTADGSAAPETVAPEPETPQPAPAQPVTPEPAAPGPEPSVSPQSDGAAAPPDTVPQPQAQSQALPETADEAAGAAPPAQGADPVTRDDAAQATGSEGAAPALAEAGGEGAALQTGTGDEPAGALASQPPEAGSEAPLAGFKDLPSISSPPPEGSFTILPAPGAAEAPQKPQIPFAGSAEQPAGESLAQGDPAPPQSAELPLAEGARDEAADAAEIAQSEAALPPLTPEEEAMLAAIARGEAPLPELPPLDPAAGEAEAAPEAEAQAAAEAAAEATPPAGEEATLPVKPEVRRPDSGEGSSGRLAAAPSLIGREGSVTTNRLPQITPAAPDLSAAEGLPADPGGIRLEGIALPSAAALPREQFARSFENSGARPLFAVLLIDDGAAAIDREALASLPFPVSFALDPQDPGAAARAALYRAADQEVVMLTSFLPEGAAASDLEVAFAAMGEVLPEAVAVMDLPEKRFQNDRPLATMVVPVIEGQGRGLITWDQGLNAAEQVARRAGLPSAVIFRALDNDQEEVPLIRRYLDRAAFKAVQDGQVMVVGRLRGETISALLEWSLEGRAASVTLAPVTAVLQAD